MTGRRWLLIAVAFVVVAVAITVKFVFFAADPNHQTAEQVVQNAGVPAGVTPGPGPGGA